MWFPGTGTWYRIEHGHVIVGRGRTAVWRSRETLATGQIGVIAAGRHAVAFQHDHRLYMAPLGGAERPIAARELPLGWTAAGLYTYSYPRRELLLRRDNGEILKTVGRRPLEYQFDLGSGSLYFLEHGVLIGARGTHVWRLASLSGVGMSANTFVQPVGGLVELLDDRRLAVVRPDGSLFASTPVGGVDRITSALTISPGASTVAFTGLTGPLRHPTAENVYLLRAGAHAAIAVHRQAGSFGGCVQWADLQWHGSRLLYRNSDGDHAEIDTAGLGGPSTATYTHPPSRDSR